jgi:hypothetical protein
LFNASAKNEQTKYEKCGEHRAKSLREISARPSLQQSVQNGNRPRSIVLEGDVRVQSYLLASLRRINDRKQASGVISL